MSDFVPTDDQTNNLIHPAWEEIRSSAEELQKDLGCDKEYIREINPMNDVIDLSSTIENDGDDGNSRRTSY